MKPNFIKSLIKNIIFTIGKDFIDNENRAKSLRNLDEQTIIKRIINTVSLVESSNEKEKDYCLGYIIASINELRYRNSNLINSHTGTPWKAINYLHRILFHRTLREVKYLPGKIFSEGIYYDEELIKEARRRILENDLKELSASFANLLNNPGYCQKIPIAHTIKSIYEFHYDECHLQFLKHSTESFLEGKKFNIKIGDGDSNRYYLLYIITIGEAFHSLSNKCLKNFDKNIVKHFISARNILAHPEREDVVEMFGQLNTGELSISSLLGIVQEEEIFEAVIKINKSVNDLQKSVYNYKFNEDILPEHRNPSNILDPVERSILTAEFLINYQIYGNRNVLPITYDFVLIDQILPVVDVNNKFDLLLNSDLNGLIRFLKSNYCKYEEAVEKRSNSNEEKILIETYEKIQEKVINELSNIKSLKKIEYIFYYLSEFLENARSDEVSGDFLEEYEKIWRNSYHLLTNNNDEIEQTHLISYLNIFKVLYNKQEGYFFIIKKSGFFENKEKGYIEFKQHYEIIRQKVRECNLECDENDKKKQEENFLSENAASAFNIFRLINGVHNIMLEYEESYYAFTHMHLINPQLKMTASGNARLDLLMSASSYLMITSGGLVRKFLDNPIFKRSPLPEETITFLKKNFQDPRGKISHNQISLIGDKGYINDYTTKNKDLTYDKKLTFFVDGIPREGIDADENNGRIQKLNLIPRNIYPSLILKDDIYELPIIKPILDKLLLLPREGKPVHINVVLKRKDKPTPEMFVYLSDKEFRFDKNENDIKFIRNNTFTIYEPTIKDEKHTFWNKSNWSSLNEIITNKVHKDGLIQDIMKYIFIRSNGALSAFASINFTIDDQFKTKEVPAQAQDENSSSSRNIKEILESKNNAESNRHYSSSCDPRTRFPDKINKASNERN